MGAACLSPLGGAAALPTQTLGAEEEEKREEDKPDVVEAVVITALRLIGMDVNISSLDKAVIFQNNPSKLEDGIGRVLTERPEAIATLQL